MHDVSLKEGTENMVKSKLNYGVLTVGTTVRYTQIAFVSLQPSITIGRLKLSTDLKKILHSPSQSQFLLPCSTPGLRIHECDQMPRASGAEWHQE